MEAEQKKLVKDVPIAYLCHFQVEDLVSNDKLNVISEEQVFVAVMDWIKHNPSERSQYIAQVL